MRRLIITDPAKKDLISLDKVTQKRNTWIGRKVMKEDRTNTGLFSAQWTKGKHQFGRISFFYGPVCG